MGMTHGTAIALVHYAAVAMAVTGHASKVDLAGACLYTLGAWETKARVMRTRIGGLRSGGWHLRSPRMVSGDYGSGSCSKTVL